MAVTETDGPTSWGGQNTTTVWTYAAPTLSWSCTCTGTLGSHTMYVPGGATLAVYSHSGGSSHSGSVSGLSVGQTVVLSGPEHSYTIPSSPNQKKNIETFTNTRDYPVRYVIFAADGTTILKDSGSISPGGTADMTFEFLESEGPLVRKIFIPADFSDGGWVEADLDTDSSPSGTYVSPSPTPETTSTYVPPATPPTSPVNNTSMPTTAPNAGVIQPGSQTIWNGTSNTVDNERLDKATYRQGVDKQVEKLGQIKDKLEEIRQEAEDRGDTVAADQAAKDADNVDFLESLAAKNTEWQAEADAAKASTASALSDSFGVGPVGVGGPTIPAKSNVSTNMTIAKLGSRNHIVFPDSIDINPFLSAQVPEWLKSGMGIVKAMLGFFWIAWLYQTTVKDARNTLMQTFMVQPTSSGALERLAAEIPYGGPFIALGLRISWIVAVIAVFAAAIPAFVALWEADIFGDYETYRDALNTLLDGSGPWSKVLGMFMATVPFATGIAVIVVRMTTQTALTAIAVPICAWFRLSKF